MLLRILVGIAIGTLVWLAWPAVLALVFWPKEGTEMESRADYANRMASKRIHTVTRWPADPQVRVMLAQVDFGYIETLERCGCICTDEARKSAIRIACSAAREERAAMREIMRRGKA
jgi:hypothetical protein